MRHLVSKTLACWMAITCAMAQGGCTYVLPAIGDMPTGERLQAVEASPHYRDGEFKNEVQSPRKRDGLGFIWAVIRGRFEPRDRPVPPASLPHVKTDLASIPRDQDTVIWLGHSSFFVQVDGKRILVDPVFNDHAAPLPWMVKAFDGTTIYRIEEVPAVDLVLITHDHYDHLDYESMRGLVTKTRFVMVGLGNGAHLARWGFPPEKIVERDWNGVFELEPELRITLLPAQHYSGRYLGRNQSLWGSYAVESTRRRLYFSGDTGYGPHFAAIAKRFGAFDLVALDSGQYNERWADIHMTPEEASRAAELLGAKHLLVAHAGRFSLARHAWDEPFDRAVSVSAGRSYRLLTPRIGEPVRLAQEQEFTHWWTEVR